MAFCNKCGAQVADGIKFCTGCGSPMEDAALPLSPPPPVAPPASNPPPPAYAPPPVQQQSFTNGDAPPMPGSRYSVMGVGSYVGHAILFSIPLIGWIIALIMAFAAKNHNKRNFARAMLVFFVIGLVLSAIMFFVFNWVSGMMLDYLNQVTEGALGDLTDQGGFKGLQELMDMMKNTDGLAGGLEGLPTE